MVLKQTLTRKQQEILAFIHDFVNEQERLPVLDEIAYYFSMVKSNAHKHVKNLIAKNHLSPGQGKHAFALVEDEAARRIPLLGFIAAGEPIEAIQHEEYLDMERFCGPDLYALRIKGESMIDAGISDNDYVVLKKQQTAETGQIIVALINGWEATLKYFYPQGKTIELRPANKDMDSQYYPSENVKIQGVLVSLIRDF